MHDHGQRAEAARRAQRLREHGLRALDRELVRAREVDQVRRVADGHEAGLGRQLAEAREVLVGVHGRLPDARALREHLQRAAAELRRPPDRLVRSRRRSRRGLPTARLEAYPALEVPLGRSRLQSDPWPALSARGSRRLQPVCCTSAACAPRCSRGSTRATTAGASCCASRTPTRRASTPRRSSRSSARCAGSGSSGTRARASAATTAPYIQSERRPRHREVAEQFLAEGRAYRCYCTTEELAEPSARRRSARTGRSSTRAAASR